MRRIGVENGFKFEDGAVQSQLQNQEKQFLQSSQVMMQFGDTPMDLTSTGNTHLRDAWDEQILSVHR